MEVSAARSVGTPTILTLHVTSHLHFARCRESFMLMATSHLLEPPREYSTVTIIIERVGHGQGIASSSRHGFHCLVDR
jgi:hypothetical protein